MTTKWEKKGVIQEGFRRGSYTWRLKNPSLVPKEGIRTEKFQLGGFKWMVVIFKSNEEDFDMTNILLISCNAVSVRADISYSTVYGKRALKTRDKRKLKIAGAFHAIEKMAVSADKLVDTKYWFQPKDDLVLTFDLKNIRAATSDDQLRAGADLEAVDLDVLSGRTVDAYLRDNKFGLYPSSRTSHSQVCRGTLVQLWAEDNSDRRYWLCKRSENGSLVIKSCLNEFHSFESFGDLCCPRNDSWVTLFEERKDGNGDFKSVDDGSIIVFCKLWKGTARALSYVGYHFVPKTLLCSELPRRIRDCTNSLQDEENLHVYLEEIPYLKDITQETKTLKECGVISGSVIVLTTIEARSQGFNEEWVYQRPPAADNKRSALEDISDGHSGEYSLKDQDSSNESTFEEFRASFLANYPKHEILAADSEKPKDLDCFVPQDFEISDTESPGDELREQSRASKHGLAWKSVSEMSE